MPRGGSNSVSIEATQSGVPVSVVGSVSGTDAVSICPSSQFLDNIQGTVNVLGDGSDSLSVFDQSDPYSDTYTLTASTLTRTASALIGYGGMSRVSLYGGYGTDTYNITSTLAVTPMTLHAGTGNDTVNVGNATTPLDAMKGALTLDGMAGSDVLNVNDQATPAGHLYTLNGNTLTRDGAAPINFSAFETVNLTTSAYNDGFVIQAMPAGVTMGVNLGAGYNSVYGPNTSNTWVINGYAAGAGKAVLNGAATLNGVSALKGGTAPDRFVFMPGGFIPSVINGGGGGDTLDYSQYNTGVSVNLGAYGGGTYGSATGVGSSVNNIQNVIGSPYNDVLTGNNYGNVLVGGAGSDVLTGGTGPSVLIGGLGADVIHGNSGNDLIVKGYTVWDRNTTALDAIFAEWTSLDSFAQRTQYLLGPTGHYNGIYFLNPNTGTTQTVFSDGTSNTVTTVPGTNLVM
jgi:Ca2+-binding RTX toxin-like protein